MTTYLRVEQPEYGSIVFALLEQHSSDEKARNAIAGIFLNEWRWGYITGDSPPPGLQVIDRELAQSTLSAHGRVFLAQVRGELVKRFGREDDDSED